MTTRQFSRRDLGKLFAAASAGRALGAVAAPVDDWAAVRAEFDLDERYMVMNAANLAPAPRPVNDVLFRYTKDLDGNVSFQNREKFTSGREETRKKLAAFLNVQPEEIVLTRNTSEGNNFVSSGIELKPGDEVVIHDENHPTNNESWKDKAKRFGFTVRPVSIPTPPSSVEAILKAFDQALTPKTKVLSFTHVTSTFGTLFPARELCRMARQRGILTLVDGAQTCGYLELDLKDMGCDFFTSSSHKWMMGPKEAGVLYVRSDAQSRLWPSEVGVIGGQVGASKIYERLGQRDDPCLMAFGAAVDFHMRVGRRRIEKQARTLADALKEGLRKIPGVHLYSPTAPELSSAVVTFRPGEADIQKMYRALYEKHGIGCAPRGGDKPGLRFSPHIYNSLAQVDQVLRAIHDSLKA